MRSLTAALVVGVVTLVASAAEPPDYSDYPVKEIFVGKPAAPLLSTRTARMFRRNSVGKQRMGQTSLAILPLRSGDVARAVPP